MNLLKSNQVVSVKYYLNELVFLIHILLKPKSLIYLIFQAKTLWTALCGAEVAIRIIQYSSLQSLFMIFEGTVFKAFLKVKRYISRPNKALKDAIFRIYWTAKSILVSKPMNNKRKMSHGGRREEGSESADKVSLIIWMAPYWLYFFFADPLTDCGSVGHEKLNAFDRSHFCQKIYGMTSSSINLIELEQKFMGKPIKSIMKRSNR